MLIQIHMLQNYAPSNLNRDDSGSPKSAVFGGHQRGRISSQCLKRSIRQSDTFANAFKADKLLANRTRRLPQLISDELKEMKVDDNIRLAIVDRVPEIGQESAKRKEVVKDPAKAETRQLIFIGSGEAQEIAQKLFAKYEEVGDKKWKSQSFKIGEITSALGASLPLSVDIAMFGRMTTSPAFEDVHAAVQVAHALSTNRIVSEYDYFTAVDDLSGESGAGMIGDVEFNSSTYYKYFNIHWQNLVENLGGDAEVAVRAVAALIEAAAIAQPSGKQNSFAAQNLPDFVMVDINEANVPVSFANAFLTPSHNRGDSLMANSIKKLDEYAGQIKTAYGLNGRSAYFTTTPNAVTIATNVNSLPALQEWAVNQIQEAVNG